MSKPDLDQKKARQEQEERIQRQIAFASGLFQGDVTIRTLLESLAEGVVIIDNSGTILLVNTSAGQMFGYPEKELIGKPHAVIIPERFRKVLEEHEADYFKEPRIKPMAQLLDLAGRRRDGSEFPAEINLSFIETINGVLVLVLISDITMRKQFELRLRESEERFRATFNQAAVGIGHAGLDGRWLRLNQKYCDIVGYTEEEIKALTIKDITHPDDVETSMRHFQLLLEGKLGNYSLEKRFIRKDGSTVWVNLTASMVPDAGGNPIFAAVVIEDITARKRATEERERLLLQLEAVLESINEGVAISDLEGNVLTMNKEALAFHEFETIEQVRRQLSEYQELFELFDLEGRLVPVEQWPLPRALRGERFADWEVCVRRKDSGKLWVGSYSGTPVRSKSGDIILSVITMRDITERRRLEREIQDAREYAENIVETVREPLVVLNSDLKILSANQSFYSTFKVTPKETIGSFIYDLGNRQWDIPKLRVLFENILPHDTVFNSYEVEHDFQDIGRKIILLNARQIFRKNIGSHIILLAMEDITERRQVEERISVVIRQQQAILNNIPNIAWLKDREGRYVAVNDPFCTAFGVAPKDLIGKNVYDIYSSELAVKYEKDSKEVMATGERTYFEESIVSRDGKTRYMEKIETPIFNDAGTVIGIIGIAHNITSRKETEIALRHDSTHDMLTGLYNRAFFDEELQRLAHGRMFPMSIVMADVNGLKKVNDTLGHEAGDDLIRMAARLILEAFRAEDIVARIGGDEFAVLLPGTDKSIAEEAVKRIMSRPEISNGLVSIAFGIASAENKNQLAEALKLSDERMYRHKSDQKEG